MDLRHSATPPTDAEHRAVDAVLSAHGLGRFDPDAPPVSAADAQTRRHLLLPALQALQSTFGWVSPGGMGYVCRRLGLAPAEGYGVASFYHLLSLSERPSAFAHVCDDIACRAAGAEPLCAELESKLGPPASAGHHKAEPQSGPPSTAPAGAHGPARWSRSPCLGMCDQAPAAFVTRSVRLPVERSFGGITAEAVSGALSGHDVAPRLCHLGAKGPRRLLARAGRVDPTRLDDYRAHGGYQALRKALEHGPEWVVREVTDAKLVGRGGAAFPTGRKWEAVAKAPVHPHYVVCNGDESEPGTFKDRVLLELDPFGVLEAMTLAGFATGAQKGYLYIRGEYPLARERIRHAISEAHRWGLLGTDILGKGFSFDVELRSGAGAYICGEETALFNSIEGYRGEPRSKPPFPVQSGLFGKPTAINNVETLVAVLDIVRDGAAAYASVGTKASPGTKLFCVSGKVKVPGLYEVPFGTRLEEVIALAGGLHEGRSLRAVLLGGAAGGFVGPSELSLPLSFEGAREAGTTLGSGVVMVLDDTVALMPLLRRIAQFFKDESCGQCVPCRVGTVRQDELLARLAAAPSGAGVKGELELLADLSRAMRDASICGLGQAATAAVESALRGLDWKAGKHD